MFICSLRRAFARLPTLALALAVSWLAGPARAADGDDGARRPRIFLQCVEECFEAYLHQELSYFDFVRAPRLADMTLLIVRQPAGNGGERFTLTIEHAEDAGMRTETTRTFTTKASTTPHDARDELVQVALRALHTALETTPHERAFQLSLPTRDGAVLSALDDPWDYWVITPEIKGEGGGQAGHYWANVTGALTVRRLTDASKLRLRGSYTREQSGYDLGEDGWIRGDNYTWEGRALHAISVGRHVALGATATARASEFENLEGHVHGGPVAEANVFPYAESQSRQLRIVYQAGPWANWYFEPNERGRLRELRPYHALSLVVDVNQSWGSVQWVGQVNQFIDAPELYRLSSGAVLSLELWRGFAFGLEGRVAYVRDLIGLRGRTITDQELILWTAQQRTDYTVEAAVLFSYTFGSVHNTIVNPRFDRVDVAEE